MAKYQQDGVRKKTLRNIFALLPSRVRIHIQRRIQLLMVLESVEMGHEEIF